ncbi:hypothetical protein D3C77_708690 [compost metagenome]
MGAIGKTSIPWVLRNVLKLPDHSLAPNTKPGSSTVNSAVGGGVATSLRVMAVQFGDAQ